MGESDFSLKEMLTKSLDQQAKMQVQLIRFEEKLDNALTELKETKTKVETLESRTAILEKSNQSIMGKISIAWFLTGAFVVAVITAVINKYIHA